MISRNFRDLVSVAIGGLLARKVRTVLLLMGPVIGVAKSGMTRDQLLTRVDETICALDGDACLSWTQAYMDSGEDRAALVEARSTSQPVGPSKSTALSQPAVFPQRTNAPAAVGARCFRAW